MSKMNKVVKGILVTPIGIIGGILGALGGADNSSKAYRRWGIPILLVIVAFLKLHSFWTIGLFAIVGILSMGYGIPSADDPKPSFLGKLFFTLTKGNLYFTNIFTRGTLGALISLVSIVVPLLKGNWLVYVGTSIGIILINALVSWKDLGMFKLFKKDLLWSEAITWGSITSLLSILIFY